MLSHLQVFAHDLLFFWNTLSFVQPPTPNSLANSPLPLKTHGRHVPCEAFPNSHSVSVSFPVVAPHAGSPNCLLCAGTSRSSREAHSLYTSVFTLLVLHEVQLIRGVWWVGVTLSPNPAFIFCPLCPLTPILGWQESGKMVRGEPRPGMGAISLGCATQCWAVGAPGGGLPSILRRPLGRGSGQRR